jgi:hypothetical protein
MIKHHLYKSQDLSNPIPYPPVSLHQPTTPHQEKMIKEGVKAIFHKYKEAI